MKEIKPRSCTYVHNHNRVFETLDRSIYRSPLDAVGGGENPASVDERASAMLPVVAPDGNLPRPRRDVRVDAVRDLLIAAGAVHVLGRSVRPRVSVPEDTAGDADLEVQSRTYVVDT